MGGGIFSGRIAAGVLIGVLSVVGFVASAAYSTTACPVTIPNGSPFPPGGGSFTSTDGRPPPTHGNGQLWVGYLTPDGVITVREDYVRPDGSIELKFPWARRIVETTTIDGALTGVFAGELEIDVRRLDGQAPPARVSTNPQGVHVGSIITFPSTGCWAVTGRTGEEALTFTFLLATEGQATPNTALPQPTPLIPVGAALVVAGLALGLWRLLGTRSGGTGIRSGSRRSKAGRNR